MGIFRQTAGVLQTQHPLTFDSGKCRFFICGTLFFDICGKAWYTEQKLSPGTDFAFGEGYPPGRGVNRENARGEPMINYDNTYVKIDLDVIEANFRAVAEKAGVPVMAIVKADAYGHGAVEVARALEGKCAFFGVSSMLEALELRQHEITSPILILGHTPPAAFSQAIPLGIRPAIFCQNDALALSAAAQALGVTAPFHIAVDTGMGRIGLPCTREAARLAASFARLPGLTAEGLFSHFATADCADLRSAKIQAEKFDQFQSWLREEGIRVPICHMDNSAGTMNFQNHYDMVRSGIVTYGLYPSDEVDPTLLKLTPALSWHSRVTHVKTLPEGCPISYGGVFVTQRETVVATIPVGYADGYRRSLSGRFYVLIHGQRAPILGRICMDQMMVDVTGIEGVAPGDKVVLIGTQEENTITMEQISQAAGSFNYEFVCGISRRVPRLYRRNGKTTHSVHYLIDN